MQRMSGAMFGGEAFDLAKVVNVERKMEDDWVKEGGRLRPKLWRDRIKNKSELNHNRIKLPYDLQASKYTN